MVKTADALIDAVSKSRVQRVYYYSGQFIVYFGTYLKSEMSDNRCGAYFCISVSSFKCVEGKLV